MSTVHVGDFEWDDAKAQSNLAKHGVSWTTVPYAAMHKNGGGIHCSTTPLRRDAV